MSNGIGWSCLAIDVRKVHGHVNVDLRVTLARMTSSNLMQAR